MSIRRLLVVMATTLATAALGACSVAPQRATPPAASGPPPRQAAAPVAIPKAEPLASIAHAIEADAKQSDAETNDKARAELALDATRRANDCIGRAPQAAACLYGSALALGLEARVHPTRAMGLLKEMLENLARAEEADAAFADAGPARVTAQVLLKAPGWPIGPGDADKALAAARRAALLKPDYPPNQLVLGQALEKAGDSSAAQEAYAHARRSALAMPASQDRIAWLKDANQGLVGK